MARVAAVKKVAHANAILVARTMMKGAGPSHTASTKAVHHSSSVGGYVKKLKTRKIRLRGSKPSSF